MSSTDRGGQIHLIFMAVFLALWNVVNIQGWPDSPHLYGSLFSSMECRQQTGVARFISSFWQSFWLYGMSSTDRGGQIHLIFLAVFLALWNVVNRQWWPDSPHLSGSLFGSMECRQQTGVARYTSSLWQSI